MTSEEITLAFSGATLVEYHGMKPWRDLELRKAGQFSRIISSKLKGKAPLKKRNSKMPGSLYG